MLEYKIDSCSWGVVLFVWNMKDGVAESYGAYLLPEMDIDVGEHIYTNESGVYNSLKEAYECFVNSYGNKGKKMLMKLGINNYEDLELKAALIVVGL